eukprot:GHVU01087559.1.p2 GENE.GHVU01087559.1~~GHVU01087559.1.p2  ORF type:complete len:120 (+),score=0.84 GHVU01087559.1:384-743(+)
MRYRLTRIRFCPLCTSSPVLHTRVLISSASHSSTSPLPWLTPPTHSNPICLVLFLLRIMRSWSETRKCPVAKELADAAAFQELWSTTDKETEADRTAFAHLFTGHCYRRSYRRKVRRHP